MSDDITSLGIRVESGDVGKATRDMDALVASSKKAEKSTDDLGAGFARLAGRLGLVAAATAGLYKLVDTARTFQALEASLTTVTGSAEKAAVAMQAIQDFAASTPYDVKQATEAFIALQSRGLDPSERALRAYGNTASAMGKQLIDFVAAVGNASVGEFENLKTFGIKAVTQADSVAFSFRGTTTQVAKNAEEIEKYLMKIGETDFAGAMELRAKTLDGAISNLGDAWDQLFNTISKAGVGNIIADGVQLANEAITELTTQIASGQLQANFTAIFGQFDNYGKDIKTTFEIVSIEVSAAFAKMGNDGKASAEEIRGAFATLPTFIRGWVQEATVNAAAAFDKLKAERQYFDAVQAAEKEDDPNAVMALKTVAANDYQQALDRINGVRKDSISDIEGERDAALKSYTEQIALAKQLREQFDADKKARQDSTEDRLAQFKQGGDGKGTTKSQEQVNQFNQVKQQLANEEESIRTSYEKRNLIILKNTAEGSDQRAELIKKNEMKLHDELQNLRQGELESAANGLMSEEMQIEASYERRLDIIRKATMLSEQEKTDLMEAAEADRISRQQELNDTKQAQQETGYGQLYNTQMEFTKMMEAGMKASGTSQVAIMTNAFAMITSAGAQQNKTMFQINKVAGIANAIVSTYIAATKALELGPIAGPIAAGIIAAAGMANVAVIASTQFGGGSSASSPSTAGALAGTGATGATTGMSLPSTPTAAAGTTINIYGDISSNDSEKFLSDLKGLINDGDHVLIEPYSRNGQELKRA